MMPLSEIFALGLLAYLLYKLIFNFFVPIFKTTRRVRQQFRHMRDTMNGQQPGGSPFTSRRQDARTQNGSATGASATRPSGTGSSTTKPSSGKADHHPSFDSIGEYIDFEEIKE